MTKEYMTKEKISYRELARRVGDCVMANNLRRELLLSDYEFELFNGENTYCYKHESKDECNEKQDCNYESKDIYQEYIITQGGAEYLQRVSDEIVYYCEKLDIYLWGITHFGTSWDGVYTEIKA